MPQILRHDWDSQIAAATHPFRHTPLDNAGPSLHLALRSPPEEYTSPGNKPFGIDSRRPFAPRQR